MREGVSKELCGIVLFVDYFACPFIYIMSMYVLCTYILLNVYVYIYMYVFSVYKHTYKCMLFS